MSETRRVRMLVMIGACCGAALTLVLAAAVLAIAAPTWSAPLGW